MNVFRLLGSSGNVHKEAITSNLEKNRRNEGIALSYFALLVEIVLSRVKLLALNVFAQLKLISANASGLLVPPEYAL